MATWTKMDQALFSNIARMTQPALFRSMRNYLRKYYKEDDVFAPPEYIFCIGNIPVMLVAHMDTVFKDPPKKIFYDQKQHIMWSPQGLGADDRAGVYLIWKIIQAGYRPYICLTTDEELGGIGAASFVEDVPNCLFDLKYIIELDRQGMNDCVFYSCANAEFEAFVEKYGFVTNFGSFSDISEICPVWKIAGVNLSVGYKNEHSQIETLNTSALLDTYKKVCIMLDDSTDPNVPRFEYIPDPYEFYYYNLSKRYLSAYGVDYPDDGDVFHATTSINHKCQCVKCKKIYGEDDVFPVKAKDYIGMRYYCIDCVGTDINWCKKCGQPFEAEHETDDYCPECSGKTRPQLIIT